MIEKGMVKRAMIAVVSGIPIGNVTHYGSVAEIVSGMVGKHIGAQVIGWMLSALGEKEQQIVPWQRVVNKQGYISSIKLGDRGRRQKLLLEQEGILVNGLWVDMEQYAFKADAVQKK